jgi:alpha-tubulin suppressor-like RCC1 family protein
MGNNQIGQCNVAGWTDIIEVAVGWSHTVGVKSDGTVVAVGHNDYGQCKVGGWSNIVQVSAGYGHTVGVKADGTVVAIGLNDEGQCNGGDWTDIVQAAAGSYHTVGLRSDGTVVATGLEVGLARWNLGNAVFYLVTSSTGGGEVARPGEGTFPYYPGRALNLVAEPEDGYRFVNWTGDVGTIARVDAAQTTITMNGDYFITANFAEKPSVNWALIGGIMGAAIIAGLVVLFVRRRRGVQKKGRGKKTIRTKRR